ncbi:hypothetical protein SBA4_5210015 [Candidatus Sulfopaludibacter sp. SbA4]|nr:hypothetical protein SBA4_5210015 [Candidatus Sulfopaludibacter sp. SbA4]
MIGIQDWICDLLMTRGALVESEEDGRIRAMLPADVADVRGGWQNPRDAAGRRGRLPARERVALARSAAASRRRRRGGMDGADGAAPARATAGDGRAVSQSGVGGAGRRRLDAGC